KKIFLSVVNRPRTFSSLQVSSHASRGWRVVRFYRSSYSPVYTFDAALEPDGGGLLHDVPIAHLYDPLTHRRSLRVVGNHDDGLIEAVIQLLEHVEDES